MANKNLIIVRQGNFEGNALFTFFYGDSSNFYSYDNGVGLWAFNQDNPPGFLFHVAAKRPDWMGKAVELLTFCGLIFLLKIFIRRPGKSMVFKLIDE